MLFRFIVVYLGIDLFCLFFALLIFTKTTIDVTDERRKFCMRGLAASYCVFLFLDALWACANYGILSFSPIGINAVHDAAELLVGLCAFWWFVYAEYYLDTPLANKPHFLIKALTPLALVILLFFTSTWTGFIFVADHQTQSYTAGPLHSLPFIIFFAYAFYVSIHACVYALRAKTSTKRREYLTLVFFVVAPVFSAIVEFLVISGLPIVAPAIFSAIFLVFISAQESRIYTDGLTYLNNRRRAVEYLELASSSVSEKHALLFYLIDIDYFKRINDNYGHTEGDRALCVLADGLRSAMGSRRGLVARWGGDEFVVIVREEEINAPYKFGDLLRKAIEASCKAHKLVYDMTASVGYARYADSATSIVDLADEADKAMYMQKIENHKAIIEQERMHVA